MSDDTLGRSACVARQSVEHRGDEDAFRQFAVVRSRRTAADARARQVLPAALRDEGLAETSADDPVVPRRKSATQQQTFLHHRQYQ